MTSSSDHAGSGVARLGRLSVCLVAWLTALGLMSVSVMRAEDESNPLLVETGLAAGVLPEEEQSPAPSVTEGVAPPRKPTPCIPAAKMTIRRDPVANIEVFDSLKPQHPHCVGDRVRPDMISWMNPAPYGQYVFIHHDPLLFEDIPAERYGEAFKPGVQPVVSLVKFVGAVPILPYKISMNHYAGKDYNAYYAYDHHGNLRPGVVEGAYLPDYYIGAPYPKARFKASLIEIGAATGVVFFLP